MQTSNHADTPRKPIPTRSQRSGCTAPCYIWLVCALKLLNKLLNPCRESHNNTTSGCEMTVQLMPAGRHCASGTQVSDVTLYPAYLRGMHAQEQSAPRTRKTENRKDARANRGAETERVSRPSSRMQTMSIRDHAHDGCHSARTHAAASAATDR